MSISYELARLNLNSFLAHEWVTLAMEGIDPRAEGRPRKRVYTLTAKGRKQMSSILFMKAKKFIKAGKALREGLNDSASND